LLRIIGHIAQEARVPPLSPRAGTAVDDLVTAVLTASRVLVGVAAESLVGIESTVTLPQFRILAVLDGSGETELSRLAEQMRISASTAARMIDRLLAAGLVTRHEGPGSRRPVVVALSRSGAELVWRVTDRRRAAIARIVRQMPAARRSELIETLNAFADAAGEPRDAGAAAFGW
jgi:DNA-binding MarR family transcriptional regulator